MIRNNQNANRAGLTLAELLVASTVTTFVVTALGVFTHAVMDEMKECSKTGDAAQAGRVVLARIAHSTATSRQILRTTSDAGTTVTNTWYLLLWERDGEPGDPTPGQPNWVETVIYARHKTDRTKLLEIRPQVDPSLVVPLDSPSMVRSWINTFRSGQQIVQPPIILLTDLGGISFEVQESDEPQGIAGLVQQDVQIRLNVSPANEQPTVFFGSATRRYIGANSGLSESDETED